MAGIFDLSTTPASNTAIAGINVNTGWPPSNVGPAFRELMAEVKGALVSVACGGTADVMTATLAPVPAALVDGMEVHLRAVGTNTVTTPSLNINGLGAKTITRSGGSALVAGDIPAALAEFTVRYNLANTRFELLNPATAGGVTPVAAGGTGAATLAANAILIGNGTAAVTGLAPSTTRKVAISDGTNWASRLLVGLDLPPGTATNFARSSVATSSTGTTTIPYDDTIPQNTEGDEYLTLAYTPLSATSLLVIDVLLNGAVNNASDRITVALFQDTTADALATVAQGTGATNSLNTIRLRHIVSAASLTARTYKVRAAPATNTLTFNGSNGGRIFGGVLISSITITEILP